MELRQQQQVKRPCLLAAAAYVLMVAANIFAEAVPINGVTSREVSDRYQTLITPAPGTFVIWFAIWVLLLLYTLYQCGVFQWKEGRGPCSTELTRAIAPLFSISSVCNTLWIISWHYELILVCFVLIAALLYCLIRIMRILTRERLCIKEKLFAFVPFSVYVAWVIIATFVNAAALLVSLDWDGWGIAPQIWAVAALFICTALGIYLMFRWKSAAIGIVFIWGYGGILVAHASPEIWNGAYPLVIMTLIVCLIALLFSFSIRIYQKRP